MTTKGNIYMTKTPVSIYVTRAMTAAVGLTMGAIQLVIMFS